MMGVQFLEGGHISPALKHLVQTCAGVSVQIFEYFLHQKYTQKELFNET